MSQLTRVTLAALAVVILVVRSGAAQSERLPLEFTAIAIANDELGSGAGTVIIRITRWSSEAEQTRLIGALQKTGQRAMLEELVDLRSVGSIRTPDSLAYDLRFAQQTPLDEGGRRIVLATDRPLSFWEAWNRPRSVDYPFTVIQMEIDRNGEGRGTMSYATRIRAYGKTIELENFSIAPIMLREIRARRVRD